MSTYFDPDAQEEAHSAPAVLLRLESEARAGWDRMLTAGPGGATLVVAAHSGEQLDEMLAGLQEGPAGAQVCLMPITYALISITFYDNKFPFVHWLHPIHVVLATVCAQPHLDIVHPHLSAQVKAAVRLGAGIRVTLRPRAGDRSSSGGRVRMVLSTCVRRIEMP